MQFVCTASEVPQLFSARFREVRIEMRGLEETIWNEVPGMIEARDAAKTLIWRAR